MSPTARERLLNRFRTSLIVKAVPNTSIVEVRFRSSDPKLATEVANSITDCYMERTFRLTMKEPCRFQTGCQSRWKTCRRRP